MTVDPGATPVPARSLAPDLARGGMLLLIAVANVHTYLYARGPGLRGYPGGLDAVDRIVVLVQMLLVDGRAYPLFALLFGYGITQLVWRRAAVGMPAPLAEALVRRRGAWLVAIGAAHGLLLFSGDIAAAYGLLAVLLAGVLVTGSDRALLGVAAAGTALAGLIATLAGVRVPAEVAALRSVATADPLGAAALRAVEWTFNGLLLQGLTVFGAVALGAWAARRRLLDDPAAHRALLRRVAVTGIGAGLLLGLPFALITAGFWAGPGPLASAVHTVGGYAAGAGYAAVFGLVAIRPVAIHRVGPVGRAVAACGQRSLSCYLAQSVAFVALLPAWTLGLGATATVWQVSLLALGVWLVTVAVAAGSARAGYRGPAETLLRRLTYGSPQRPART